MSDIKLTSEQLEDMLDNAARRGAKEALRSIGLLDDDANLRGRFVHGHKVLGGMEIRCR